MEKTELGFENLVEQWRRINSVIPANPLIWAVYNYCCENQDPFLWELLFDEIEEKMKVVQYFRKKNGDEKRVKGPDEVYNLSCDEQLLLIYLTDKETTEFAYFAHILLKIYDFFYPRSRVVSPFDIIGKDGVKCLGNMASTSFWGKSLLSQTAFLGEQHYEDPVESKEGGSGEDTDVE